MKHITALLVPICILVVAVLAVTSTPAAAAPPYPSYGTAVVDGNSSEWNLTNDYFATFCNTAPCNEPAPGGPQPMWAQVQGAKLYLRYSCDTHLLYVLVLAQGRYVIGTASGDNEYVSVGTETNRVVSRSNRFNTSPPLFKFLTPSPSKGWEADFSINPGSYNMWFSATIVDTDGSKLQVWAGGGDVSIARM